MIECSWQDQRWRSMHQKDGKSSKEMSGDFSLFLTSSLARDWPSLCTTSTLVSWNPPSTSIEIALNNLSLTKITVFPQFLSMPMLQSIARLSSSPMKYMTWWVSFSFSGAYLLIKDSGAPSKDEKNQQLMILYIILHRFQNCWNFWSMIFLAWDIRK